MASPPILDFAALLAPIPGDAPAGVSVSYELREKLEEHRKEVNPDDFPADDPTRPAEAKKADWPAITQMAQDTLTSTSKDLLVAARLTEALVKQHGFAGLRDGLQLMRRLIAECWDRIYPSIEDGDLEVRAGPFNWLDDPDRGARFPFALHSVPLLPGEGGGYSWIVWRQAQEGKGPITPEAIEKAVLTTPREHCQTLVDDVMQSVGELNQLTQLLNEKLGGSAPGLISLRQAVDDCRILSQQILQKKGPPPSEAGPEEGEVGEDGQPTVRRAMTSREEVYRRLAEAADVLQQLEPHSPIPYLIRRAVALGALPFPQLMQALIRENTVLDELSREMGFQTEQPAG